MIVLALTALCTGGVASGFLLFRRIPVIPQMLHMEISSDLVSIIIPARNEESNLLTLLTSLEYSNAEVIVVDDASTDLTASIASAFGARVISLTQVPPGWRGKNWACQQGALAASSEILLFLDADTRFASGGLERTLSYFLNLPPESALSLLPFHKTEKLYEELSLFFNLLMAAGAGGFGELDRPHLFGQSLMIRRELYLRAGGHAAVRQHVLENFYFASHIRAANGYPCTASGRGTLFIRMFPQGIVQLCKSWEKGFAAGAQGTSLAVLLLSVYWLTTAATVSLLLLLGIGIPRAITLVLYLIFAVQIAWLSRQIGSYRIITAIVYPAALLFYFIVFSRSAWFKLFRRSVSWKGRQL